MLKAKITLLVAAWIVLSATLGLTADPLTDLEQRVRQLTVAQPQDCGKFSSRDERLKPPDRKALEQAIACAVVASQARSPFWLLVDQGGFDSFVATGLLAGPDGVLQKFAYDSYGTGQFRTWLCRKPAAGTNYAERATITCDGLDYPPPQQP